jgi:glycolate oxidase
MRSSLLKKRTSVDEIDIGGDIIVPPSELWMTLEEVIKIMQKYNIEFLPIFGHIGDGNIHFDAFINVKKDSEKAKSLIKETAMTAVKHNGCISAEHGIGLEKKDALIEEFKHRNTLYNIELYRGIKKVFDPNGIMNRGKLFD